MERASSMIQQIQNTIHLSPTTTKVINSIVMSVVCVLLENQVSGHTHGVGMIAAHVPVAYLHESITYTHKSKIQQALIGLGGFVIFHGGLHLAAESLGSCNHDQSPQQVQHFGGARLQQLHELHQHTHGMDLKTWLGVVVGAAGEEIYSRLPIKKFLSHL